MAGPHRPLEAYVILQLLEIDQMIRLDTPEQKQVLSPQKFNNSLKRLGHEAAAVSTELGVVIVIGCKQDTSEEVEDVGQTVVHHGLSRSSFQPPPSSDSSSSAASGTRQANCPA